MIGLFGFPEIVDAFNPETRTIIPVSKFSAREGLRIMRLNIINVIRSGLLGVTMGAIPGVGEDTGGWLSYWAEKRFSKKTGWGKGEINGVVAAETGNNAAVGGAIIPVLSLAIPGSAPAAVLLAAFWMHGYRPGPLLMQETPEFLYYVVVFMVFSAFMMWVLASNISRFTVKILQIKNEILMPIIFVCCVIGAFVVSNRMFDVKLMFVFGILGIIMRQLKYPAAPFLLGIILGNMADENLRRALILNKGSITSFLTRPISLFFIVFILALLRPQFPIVAKLSNRITQKWGKKN
jgi:putative tricarboxylic transport membrane protein